jgi:hypothetical protein
MPFSPARHAMNQEAAGHVQGGFSGPSLAQSAGGTNEVV